jgi:DNA-directed RNA polymerase subunit beta
MPIQDSVRLRKDFAKIDEVVGISNLIDIQIKSYNRFLQPDRTADEKEDRGLQGVFKSVFPITDFYDTASLEYVSYRLGDPKYDVDECILKGATFAAPIKVTLRLVLYDIDDETGRRDIKAMKEQEVYFGEIPLMTANGTFIINGTERVIVSQLHRSPGVFFDSDRGKTGGKPIFFARIIPYRGSWIDFEFDTKDTLHVRIDRRRKLPVTVLLKALGYSTKELLDYFYSYEKFTVDDGVFTKEVPNHLLEGQRPIVDLVDPETNQVIAKKMRKINRAVANRLKTAGINTMVVSESDTVDRFLADDLVDPETGEVIAECNELLTEKTLQEIKNRKIPEFTLLFIDNILVSSSLRDTLALDKLSLTREEKEHLAQTEPGKLPTQKETERAIVEIYRRLRPGDPPTLETATNLFYNLFFNPERYDLSSVGRMKLNYKLGFRDVPEDETVLRREDILEVVKYLIHLKDGRGVIDDIDHLGNRRVRTVGELLENQYHIGLVRIERAIRERMSLQEIETLMPHDLINSKPLSAVIKEFFGSSQLSQFMDQTNPLSEITHKRRLSALGPGGLTRERAGFEVRDVHPTHYGRICPIETPEGPNIGLITSLSTFA